MMMCVRAVLLFYLKKKKKKTHFNLCTWTYLCALLNFGPEYVLACVGGLCSSSGAIYNGPRVSTFLFTSASEGKESSGL